MKDYQIIIRNRAQVEIVEIMQWYDEKEKGLGQYFLLCLEETPFSFRDQMKLWAIEGVLSEEEIESCKRSVDGNG